MRALLQRVSEASVAVHGETIATIERGLVVLLGVGREDTREIAERLARKIVQLRIFADGNRKMNLSLSEVGGELLIVSQFTLYADMRKGNRPSYTDAAPPEMARELYDYFVEICRSTGTRVSTGVFQAEMQVRLVNEGPVTLLCSSDG